MKITRISRLPATTLSAAPLTAFKCHGITTACILLSTSAILRRHSRHGTAAASNAISRYNSIDFINQEEQYEYWEEDIPTEDYTWQGDKDLDVFDEEPLTDEPMLDLTRPSNIDASGMEAEEQLAVAMEAVYHGMHSEDTLSTPQPTITTDTVEQQGGQLDPKLLRVVFGAGNDVQKPVISRDVLPPVPPHFIGDVEVRDVQGCGWGIVTTELMEAGDTLLISEPIANNIQQPETPKATQSDSQHAAATQVMQPAQGTDDVHAILVDQLSQMQDTLPSQHPLHSALSCLYQGPDTHPRLEGKENAGDDRARGRRLGAFQQTNLKGVRANSTQPSIPIDLHTWQSQHLANGNHTALANSIHRTTQQRLSQKELQRVVKYNALLNMPSDRAVSLLRQESHVVASGLWPELALINHSCAPNATAMLCGGRVIVRATTGILPGSEVFLNYLPVADALQPAAHRRALLYQRWGFDCKCQRCKLELQGEYRLSDALSSAHATAMELQRKMQQALSQWNHTATGSAHAKSSDPTLSEGCTQPPMQSPQPSSQPASTTPTGSGLTLSPDIVHLASINKPDMRKAMGSRNVLQGVDGSNQDSAPVLPDELIAELRSIESAACTVRDEVHALVGSMPELRHTPSATEQVLAGMHAVYDVIATVRTLIAPGSALMLAAWEMLTTTATAALPGSEVSTLGNAYMAAMAAERYGVSDRRALLAERACIHAFRTRYGPCTPATLQALIDSGLAVLETSIDNIRQGKQPSICADSTGMGGSTMTCEMLRWAPPAWQWDVNPQQDVNPGSASTNLVNASNSLESQGSNDVVIPKEAPRSRSEAVGGVDKQERNIKTRVRQMEVEAMPVPEELEQQLADLLLGTQTGEVSTSALEKQSQGIEERAETDRLVNALPAVTGHDSETKDSAVDSPGKSALGIEQPDDTVQVQHSRSNMNKKRPGNARLPATNMPGTLRKSKNKAAVQDWYQESRDTAAKTNAANKKSAGWMDTWQ